MTQNTTHYGTVRTTLAIVATMCASCVTAPASASAQQSTAAPQQAGTQQAGTQQASAQQASRATLSLMPVPRMLTVRPGLRLAIDTTFHVAVVQHTEPNAVQHADPRLESAIQRMLPRLERRTGLALSHDVAHSTAASPQGATLIIDCAGPGEAVQSVNENESYAIDVSGPSITLRAPTTVGVIRGLETVLQLVEGDSTGFFIPAVSIQDSPRFRWRGLLVDVSRHFEPVDAVKRTLDAMSAVKLNVLHWHLSDDQGFRVESTTYPKLQQLGSDGLYYTQAQIRDVVAYARDRGIRVVPEFDMPGHASSWFVGYPHYASAPGPYHLARTWGRFDPVPLFDPTSEDTYRFIDHFIGEMTALFPDAYWHIGGDEVNPKQWNASPRIQAFMKSHHLADNPALQAYFNQRLSRILTAHQRHMIGWDEILHPDLPKTTVVQSWRGTKYLGEAVKQDFSGILSAPYYLDAMKSAAEMYNADPIPLDSDLTAEQAARVLGGEAAMWAELITAESIDSRIWPRTAAIAERFWSPREVTDVSDMYRRLALENVQLEQLGIGSESHTDRFLRRVVNGPDIAPLHDLLTFAEPVNLGQRLRPHPTTQMLPLVFVVDAAIPDPPSKHTLLDLAAHAAGTGPANAATRDSLSRIFTMWRALPAKVRIVASHAPLAQDAVSAADALDVAAIIGQAGIGALATGKALPQTWVDAATTSLDALDKPQGLLHLTVVPAIRLLITPQAIVPAH